MPDRYKEGGVPYKEQVTITRAGAEAWRIGVLKSLERTKR